MSSKKYLDLAGLTAYDAKIKAWHHKHIVDITDDEIRALFATSSYEMVDLGLPSGLKWADRNIGASSPEDAGLYFSWGNVDGHAVDENGNVIDGYTFNSTTYASTTGGQYTGSTLDAEHDAATYNMRGDWRMPTSAETLELVENTDHYYIDLDGNVLENVNFSNLRSICYVKKDEAFDYNDRSNFIEFPFVGNCYGSLLSNDGWNGGAWSSSDYVAVVESAHLLYFSSSGSVDGGDSGYQPRYYGYSVRGVHE